MLTGLRVVDASRSIAGAYAGFLLAGLGAEVTLLEDDERLRAVRYTPPYAQDRISADTALLHLHMDRGKSSCRLSSLSREQLVAALSGCDVVMWDGRDDVAGIGDVRDEVVSISPHVVFVELVPTQPVGDYGSWRLSELTLAALSGIASCTGEPDGRPLKVGGYPMNIVHGQIAAAAGLVALFRAFETGQGGTATVAALEAAITPMEILLTGTYRSTPAPRRGRQHPSVYPHEAFDCVDGVAGIHAPPGRWEDFLELIEAPAGIPRGVNPMDVSASERAALREQLDPVIDAWLKRVRKLDAYHQGQAKRCAFGYVATASDLYREPHLRARQFLRSLQHPVVGTADYPGAPFRPGSPWRHERAPMLGEHGRKSLQPKRVAARRRPPGRTEPNRLPDAAPLSGIRVLDLSQIWAGPRAVRILADWGADVVKVESVRRTDSTRRYPRFLREREKGVTEREFLRGVAFEHLHRGKRSITLDLSDDRGRQALLGLVGKSDVVVANFAYGVLERLKLDWSHLREVNPHLVLLSMTGFGDSGPQRDYVAYGVTLEELCGMYARTGYAGGRPLKSGPQVGDPMNGLHGAVAVLAALVQRQRTGHGQYIELSQLESSVCFAGESLLDFAFNGREADLLGNNDLAMAPHDIYPCAGQDQWIAIAIHSDEEWQQLSKLLGLPQIRGTETVVGRQDNVEAIDKAIAAATRNCDKHDLAQRLQVEGLDVAPVLATDEVMHDKHLLASGFLQDLSHQDGGSYRYLGPLWTLDGGRPNLSLPAPLLGEHREEILRELGGYGEDDIADCPE